MFFLLKYKNLKSKYNALETKYLELLNMIDLDFWDFLDE